MNINELISKMTLKEKVGQLVHGTQGFDIYKRDDKDEVYLTQEFKDYVSKYGSIGVLFSFFRADHYSKWTYSNGGITLEEREKVYNLLQKYIVENTRLGIPVLMEEDAPHGRLVLDSVMFPSNINVGFSFNPDLYKRQVYCICKEAKLGGVHCPNFSLFDMPVDPRWGRSEECFTEDPYLASLYSQNAVWGAKEAESLICCKHYVGQGACLGGHNGCTTNIGERELREIHLPAVKSAVKAGADFIMAAYNDFDGVPCHSSTFLLQDILREEFGFDGVIRADSCAIDNLNELTDFDYAKASSLAMNAGVDVGLHDKSYAYLEEAVIKGYIKEERIDEAVYNLLKKKEEIGLLDNPYISNLGESKRFLESKESENVAYEMAAESLVLLKNNGLLPLNKNKKILLIGENLDDVYYLLGDYTSERKNNDSITSIFPHPYLKGWTFKEGVVVDDKTLEKEINKCDVVLFGCGGSSVRDFNSLYLNTGAVDKSYNFMDCGEGCDLSSLELISAQKELIKKISKYDKPILSILLGGRGYLINDIISYSDAFIFAGYPGDKGAKAIKDTIYGEVNNFGRLAISLAKTLGQLPIFYNYRTTKNYVDIDYHPLFPFGYGLSYSSFTYNNFKIVKDENIHIYFDIKNESDIKGKAVPQLYIRHNNGTIYPRNKMLKRFEKIEILPQETKQIHFVLNKEDLLEWSINNKYENSVTNIDVLIGEDSQNVIFKEKVRI